ncbi:MAG: TolC family outer membrane protein [Betaproteobacteria bacterium]|nr:TolC family outer membrane protein [Betaproteobacteria bacterium]
MNKKTPLLVAGWIAATFAGPGFGADLMAVYRDAVAYDAQYAAARAALEAGREKLPQGRAGLLPNVGLTGSTVWNELDTNFRTQGVQSRDSQYNTNGWTVSLTQPLFRWQNWVSYTQSELAVVQAEAQFRVAQQELIIRTVVAYFDVLVAQDVLATTQAQKAAIAEQLESAKRNFEVGTATITDSQEAQSRYDLAIAQEIAAQNDLNVKRQVLRTIIGKEPEGLKPVKSGVRLDMPQPPDIEKWAEMAETGSNVVQVSQAQYEIAMQEIERQRAGHYPTVDLVATRGRSSTTSTVVAGVTAGGSGSDTDASTIGLQLSIPIFAGGATSSRTREAVALKEKASADLENARRTAALNARQGYLGVHAGVAQIKAFEAALASSQLSVDSNKLGYEVGVRINIDVLNAQSQLYETRQKLVKARMDLLISLLRLKAASGSLNEEDVAAINALLE